MPTGSSRLPRPWAVAKLPDPPGRAALRRLEPSVQVLSAQTWVARVYFAGGDHPMAWNTFRDWGPARLARFDHQLPDERGQPRHQARAVLYGAPLGLTCIAEVFQHSRVIDRLRRDPFLTIFQLARPVRLLDLTGEFATRMGASLAIHSGPRDRTRRWAVALDDAYGLDGFHYLSSMHPGAVAFVLNERARDALPASPAFNRPLADPILTDVIDACATRLGYLKM